MHVLTALSLSLVVAALLWNSIYNTVIYLTAARSGKAGRGELGASRRSLVVVVPSRGEPIRILAETAARIARACRFIESRCEGLLVLDDDPDYVAKLLEELSRLRALDRVDIVLRVNGVGGRNGAMNDGVRLSSTELVMVVDADSRVSSSLIDEASRCPDVCVAPWRTYGLYGTRAEEAMRFATDLGTWVFYVLKSRTKLFVYPLGAGTIIDRRVLEDIGLWRTDVVQDDMWLGTELARRGLVPRVLNSHLGVSAPPTLDAAAIQLTRWSYGAVDVVVRFWRNIASSPLPPASKIEAYAYLLQPLQSVIGFAGLLLGIPAMLLERCSTIFVPEAIIPYAVFIAVSAVYAAIVRRFVESFGEELYRAKAPFLMGRSSAISATILPLLASSALCGLVGKRLRYRITPKEVGSRRASPIAICSSIAWGSLFAASLALSNMPVALMYLAFLAGSLYSLIRLRS